MAKDPLDLWNREIPETTGLALKELVFAATAEAYALCRAEYPGYAIAYIAGQHRFTKLQYKMLEFGATDPVLRAKTLFHLNGMPFAQLFANKLQMTSATVESEHATPQLSLLRDAEQAQQLRFFEDQGVLVCHLCVCVEGDLSKPRFVHVRFPNGSGGYLEPFVDLTHLARRAPILPVESVRDNKPVRERGVQTPMSRDEA